tara:strand:+ start:11316 stop:13745 length:2430 start_codon:yes stop_codon:yes gene_type:complete
MATCKQDAISGGLDELTVDKLMENVELSDKNAKELVQDLINEQTEATFQERSNAVNISRGRRFIENAKITAEKTKRPFKKFWKYFFDDKTSVGVRVTTRIQRRLADIAAETNIPIHDFFKLIEGHIIQRVNDRRFRDAFINEMMSEGNTMVSGNKIAFQVATAVKRQQAIQLAESRKYGSGLYMKKGWVTSQWHDPIKIKNVSADKWVDDIISHIDVAATKKNIRLAHPEKSNIPDYKWNTEEYLKSVYHQIIDPKLNGNGVILENVKKMRILEFKDSNHLLRYNDKYGHDNLAHAIFQNMDAMDHYLEIGMVMGFGAKQRKLNQNFIEGGPRTRVEVFDPISELRALWDDLKANNKISGREWRSLNAGLRELVGDHSLTGRPMISQLTTAFIAQQAMSKLGKAVFQATADLGSTGIVLHHQGIRPDKAYYGMIKNMVRIATDQLHPMEKKLVHQALGTGFDGMIGQNYSRYVGQWGGKAGQLSKLANHFFWMNGLIGWTNASRTAFSIMSSNQIANSLESSWKSLGKNQRNNMIRYGLTENDWLELQKIGSFNAREWNPKASVLENYITRDWILEQGGSTALANKLDNFFIQESRSAVPEAKIADRVIMYGNHDPGSTFDVIRKLAGMFRTYQIQQVKTLYPRVYELGLPAIVHALPIIGVGYASVLMKNLVAGKEPPEFDDPDLFIDVMIRSGFAPLVGDYLAGEYGRYNHTWDEAIGGAAYSQFKEWGELWVGLMDGSKNASDAWKSLRYNTPFANLFYTEAALNYGLHYAMMESLNPGYLYRIEAQAEGRGSPFLYEPSNLYGGY